MSYIAVEGRKDKFSVSNSALTIKDLKKGDFGTYTFSNLEVTIQTFKLSEITGKRIKYSIMSHTMGLIHTKKGIQYFLQG